jgi:prophage regulatory protein
LHRHQRNISTATGRQTDLGVIATQAGANSSSLQQRGCVNDAAIPVCAAGDPPVILLFTLTLEAYMDQQTVNGAVERRASSNRADVRFLRLKEVLAICGKSRSSVYDAIKKGDFPKPVKLSGRSSAWIKSEVEQWAVDCIRASRHNAKT